MDKETIQATQTEVLPIEKSPQQKQLRQKLRMKMLGQLIRKKENQLKEKLVKLQQTYPNIKKGLLHNQMGCAFLQGGRNQKAQEHLKKAEQLITPYLQFSNIYMNLGNLEAQKRNYLPAIQMYKKVIQMSPYNKQLECQKDFEDMRYLGKFNSYDAYVDAYTNLSVMYSNNDQPQKGLSYCEKAIELNPESIESNINYGDILRQVGRKQDAIEHTWKQLVKLTKTTNPQYERNPWIQIKPVAQIQKKQQQKFINVLCFKWGKRYGPDYVNKLYKGIQRNTTWKFKFFCFTEDSTDLNQNIIIMPLQQGWPKWWGKVTLFNDYKQIVGKRFYIDLDMIITGNLDDIFGYHGQFGTLTTEGIACEKQHKSGYNSSVMIWSDFKLTPVYNALKDNFSNIKKFIVRFDFWLQMNIKNADYLQEVFSGQISDFVQSCQKQVPNNTRIVCFPRKPKPDQYPSQWIKQYWIE